MMYNVLLTIMMYDMIYNVLLISYYDIINIILYK